MFNFFPEREYKEILQKLHSSEVFSTKKLVRLAAICHPLIVSTQNLNEKAAICLTQSEIYVRLSLNLITEQDDKNATYYYNAAFEACDSAEEYIAQLQEEQQSIDESLLKESNTYGLIIPEACKDKVYEIVSKPLDELLEKNNYRNT